MHHTLRKYVILLLLIPALGISVLPYVPALPLHWGEMARFAPYYWLLPPSLLALVLVWAWHLGKWFILLAVINLLLIASFCMGLRWNIEPEKVENANSLRVLSYNAKVQRSRHTHGGLDVLSAEIRSHNADLIALQDADDWFGVNPESPPVRLPSFLGYPYALSAGQYIVASRFPIRACEAHRLGNDERSSHYLQCGLLVHGKPLTLVTAHLISPRGSILSVRDDPLDGVDGWNANLDERIRESGLIAAAVQHLPRPLLVMGDFNAREESPVVQNLLRTGLRDAWSVAGRGWGFTYGHAVHKRIDFLRIDHILVSPELAVSRARVGGSLASEHNPVIADLLLP